MCGLQEVIIQNKCYFPNPWPKKAISQTPMKRILILNNFDLLEVIWRPICGLWEVIIWNWCYFWNHWPKNLYPDTNEAKINTLKFWPLRGHLEADMLFLKSLTQKTYISTPIKQILILELYIILATSFF